MSYFTDLKIKSPANEDVNSEISFVLDVRLKICHFKVVCNPVHNKVWEPRILSLNFKQAAEEFETVLAKVVAEYFEGHQGRILL